MTEDFLSVSEIEDFMGLPVWRHITELLHERVRQHHEHMETECDDIEDVKFDQGCLLEDRFLLGYLPTLIHVQQTERVEEGDE